MINPLITSELLFEGAKVPLHLIYLVFYLKLATPTTEKHTRYRGTNKHHRVHPGIFSQVCISLTWPPRPCWSDSPATSVPFCTPPSPSNAQALVSGALSSCASPCLLPHSPSLCQYCSYFLACTLRSQTSFPQNSLPSCPYKYMLSENCFCTP